MISKADNTRSIKFGQYCRSTKVGQFLSADVPRHIEPHNHQHFEFCPQICPAGVTRLHNFHTENVIHNDNKYTDAYAAFPGVVNLFF